MKARCCSFVLFCIVFNLYPLSLTLSAAEATTCSLGKKSWNPGAPARFGLSVSLRKVDQANPIGCGIISQEALQIYVAAQWVSERLNAEVANSSFIPGVQFGFDLLDDCRSPTKAVQYALDYVDMYSDYCHVSPNSTVDSTSRATQLRLGVVGPTRSSTAEETADAMRSIPIPIISPAATLASLTEGDTPHPNFFRTVPSDKQQIKAMVSLLKKLLWTFVAVVYTDDNYGVAGSRLLQKEAKSANICINETIPISSATTMVSVVSHLVRTKQNAEGESLAVVYIGEKDKAENLIFYVRSKEAYGLHFIMSDSVSTNTDVFESGRLASGVNIATGSLTLAPSSLTLHGFQTYLNQKYRDVKDGKVSDDVIKSYLEESSLMTSSEPLNEVQQISFVPLAVNAIFALAEATRLVHQEKCGGVEGVCADFLKAVRDGDVLTRLATVKVEYGTMDQDRAPQEFRTMGYVVEFDENGDVVPKPQIADYTIFAYDDNPDKLYNQVGTFRGGELTLDMSPVRMLNKQGDITTELQTSVCAKSCAECADNGKIPLAFLNGTAFIIGIFSMHERNANQPFECGDFRNVSNDAVVLEAFMHAVQQQSQKTGIDFGAVAFDDCYSPLHITSILSDFLSGLVPYDKGLFDVCVSREKVVGMVGSLSSDSTLAVASFNTPQGLPTISYAASSPDLDDPVNYPYFLRTVPSDEEQGIAMTELILAMGWEYVGLLYVSNNYGTKGAQAFRRIANQRGVCVATPVPISVNPTNVDEKHLYDAFVQLVQQNVKVVVFFGIDTRMADFLRLIETRNEQGSLVFIASEEWGTKNDVLTAGEKAARGSITFKVDNTFINPDVETSLRNRLLEKTMHGDGSNPWFSEFWQHIFDCNIPGGFNNIFNTNCDPNIRLSTQQVDSMMSDQRVKHVMNAVQALAEGMTTSKTQICEDSFPCSYLRSDKYAQEVYDTIRSQTVSLGSSQEELFDQNGNGNIGFSIYNIQRQGEGYIYNQVGKYSKKTGLEVTKEKIHFYTERGLSLDSIDASCTADLCSAPECSATPKEQTTPAPVETTDKEFRMADMVILIVLVIFSLLLVCCMCVGFKYFRQKVRGLSKDLQNNKSEPIYHVVQSQQPTYNNLDPSQPGMSLPLPSAPSRIQFVNAGFGSGSNSPGNTLDGRTNPAFLSENNINGMFAHSPSERSRTPSPHRKRTPPPPLPPLPSRSPGPPFHHSVSAVARLQHDEDSGGSEPRSPHNYYMPHVAHSIRELPLPPLASTGAHSSARSFRSFQSCPAERQERMENIALQEFTPCNSPHNARAFQQRGDKYPHSDSELSVDRYPNTTRSVDGHRLRAAGSEPSIDRFSDNDHWQQNDIQYFHMAPSGQLEERHGEEEEDRTNLRTYSLSPLEEDQPALNTYSLSPALSRAAHRQSGHSRQSQDIYPQERHDSLPSAQYNQSVAPTQYSQETSPTQYSQVTSPTQYSQVVQRANSSHAHYPAASGDSSMPATMTGFIQPLRITEDMKDLFLQQLLMEKFLIQPLGAGYPVGSLESLPSNQAFSRNSPANARPQQPSGMPQYQLPSGGYPGSPAGAMSQNSLRGPQSAAVQQGQTRPAHKHQWGGRADPGPTPAPTHLAASGATQSLQTGVYAPIPHYTVTSPAAQLSDMPQTQLSTPYAHSVQGQADGLNMTPTSMNDVNLTVSSSAGDRNNTTESTHHQGAPPRDDSHGHAPTSSAYSSQHSAHTPQPKQRQQQQAPPLPPKPQQLEQEDLQEQLQPQHHQQQQVSQLPSSDQRQQHQRDGEGQAATGRATENNKEMWIRNDLGLSVSQV